MCREMHRRFQRAYDIESFHGSRCLANSRRYFGLNGAISLACLGCFRGKTCSITQGHLGVFGDLISPGGISRGVFWLPGNPPTPAMIFLNQGVTPLLTPTFTSHLNVRLLETPLDTTSGYSAEPSGVMGVLLGGAMMKVVFGGQTVDGLGVRLWDHRGR